MNWEFASWHKESTPEIMSFYQNYIHDSKYGFMSNAEPFSYFRQRTVYESRRSGKGEEVDQKTAEDKAVCTVVNREVQHEEFFDAFERAKQEAFAASYVKKNKLLVPSLSFKRL